MEILNNINKRIDDEKVNASRSDIFETYEFLLTALNPIAPHITENLFQNILKKNPQDISWPADSFFVKKSSDTNFLVQVNGKVRANIVVKTGLEEIAIKEIAMKNENVARHLEKKDIIKVIFIKDKLINFVHS